MAERQQFDIDRRQSANVFSASGDAMNYDIIVVGAGPAGLAFVRGLADSGLEVALVERQSLAVLVDPARDGPEILLAHRSVDILLMLGA